MRRASFSICSNLSEGAYRGNRKEFKQFCRIAKGSAGELRYFLKLSRDIKYIDEETYLNFLTELETIIKMLEKLFQRLSEQKK